MADLVPRSSDELAPASAALFDADPVTVAPRLLGTFVQHAGVLLRITEVEAYHGSLDPGSHGFRRRTERNSALFGPPGTVYVYINYGIHRALNLVCGSDGEAAGCLVRSGEVVAGENLARQRRGTGDREIPSHQLARGPGNLAKALDIEVDLNGTPVSGDHARVRVFVDGTAAASTYVTGPRVGVSGPGGDGESFPWRFWLPGERTVSAYRSAAPSRRRRGSAGRDAHEST